MVNSCRAKGPVNLSIRSDEIPPAYMISIGSTSYRPFTNVPLRPLMQHAPTIHSRSRSSSRIRICLPPPRKPLISPRANRERCRRRRPRNHPIPPTNIANPPPTIPSHAATLPAPSNPASTPSLLPRQTKPPPRNHAFPIPPRSLKTHVLQRPKQPCLILSRKSLLRSTKKRLERFGVVLEREGWCGREIPDSEDGRDGFGFRL